MQAALSGMPLNSLVNWSCCTTGPDASDAQWWWADDSLWLSQQSYSVSQDRTKHPMTLQWSVFFLLCCPSSSVGGCSTKLWLWEGWRCTCNHGIMMILYDPLLVHRQQLPYAAANKAGDAYCYHVIMVFLWCIHAISPLPPSVHHSAAGHATISPSLCHTAAPLVLQAANPFPHVINIPTCDQHTVQLDASDCRLQ